MDQPAREECHGAKGDHDIVLRFVWQLSQEGAEVSQLHDVVLQLADLLLSMPVLQLQFMDNMRSPCSNGGAPSDPEGDFSMREDSLRGSCHFGYRLQICYCQGWAALDKILSWVQPLERKASEGVATSPD